MSWEFRLLSNEMVWECDWDDCPETVTDPSTTSITRLDAKERMPADWSGMLITSMGDGDYAAVLCPAHADSIKRMVFDRMQLHNGDVVGY